MLFRSSRSPPPTGGGLLQSTSPMALATRRTEAVATAIQDAHHHNVVCHAATRSRWPRPTPRVRGRRNPAAINVAPMPESPARADSTREGTKKPRRHRRQPSSAQPRPMETTRGREEQEIWRLGFPLGLLVRGPSRNSGGASVN